jgi:hypothetical protein
MAFSPDGNDVRILEKRTEDLHRIADGSVGSQLVNDVSCKKTSHPPSEADGPRGYAVSEGDVYLDNRILYHKR